MPGARDLRLQADFEHLHALANRSGGTINVEAVQGRPPDQVVLAYRCRGIERVEKGRPVYRDLHRLRIRLPAKYPAPSAPPIVEMLTPIFHPHVYPNHMVCIGHWETAEYLEEFSLRLGAMLQFDRRYLNVIDPADPAAMEWVQRNLLLLPTDTCSFLSEDASRMPTGQIEATEEIPEFDWCDIEVPPSC